VTARLHSPARVAAALAVVLACPLLLPAASALTPHGWSPEESVSSNGVSPSFPPQVAMAVDPAGDAIAVWQERRPGGQGIWANLFAVDRGWGEARLIENLPGYCADPSVGIDAQGNGLVVWGYSPVFSLSDHSAYAVRYLAGTGWQMPVLLDADGRPDTSNSSEDVQVAVAPGGNAVAIWLEFQGFGDNITARRFDPVTGWGAAEVVVTQGNVISGPRVAIGANGNAVAAWEAYAGGPFYMWGAAYAPGAGWGDVQMLSPTVSSLPPFVAVDPSGNGFAYWHDGYVGSYGDMMANYYSVGTGWGPAQSFDNASGGSLDPSIAFDDGGNATAVWAQFDGAQDSIFSNRYIAGSGWAGVELIEASATRYAFGPDVAVDANGNAVAVWTQNEGGNYSLWANQFVAGEGWSTARVAASGDVGSAAYPEVGVGKDGSAIVVWNQDIGPGYALYSSRMAEGFAPAIAFTWPPEGFATNRSSVWVQGVTERGALVSVNGGAASVDANGTFGVEVPLLPGANMLTARAVDRAGNVANASVNVAFVDPFAPLGAELAGINASIDTVRSAVASLQSAKAATEAALQGAQDALVAAQASATVLEAQLSSSQADLAEAHSSLAAAEASLAAVQADANATNADLSETMSNLDAAQARVAAFEHEANATHADLSLARANITAAGALRSTLQTQVSLLQSGLDAAAADQVIADARISTLENTTKGPESNPPAADAQAGAALIVAAVALVAAAVGLGRALRKRTSGNSGRPAQTERAEKPPGK
jgi:hypothetical protein